MSANQFEQAVLALHNPAERFKHEQANLFLLSFQESSQAWGVSLELLTRSASPLVQFYAANCLYSKIVRDWLQIQDDDSIASVTGILLQFLSSCSDVLQGSEQRMVAARVCLALVALSVKLGDGVPQLMQEVYARFFGGSIEALATANSGPVTLGLLLVKSLPEEVDKVDMSRMRRDELQDKLREAAPTVLKLVDFLASNRPDLCADALSALECWLGVGTITISSLSRDAPSLFDGMCRMVAAPGSVPLEGLMAACQVFTRLANISEYPRPAARDAAVNKIVQSILAGLPVAINVLDGRDDEAMHAYCSMVIELAKSEVGMLAQGSESSLAMIQMLLELTRHSNLHVASITMEFWETFRDIPMAKRHPQLGGHLCMRIIEVLVDRLSYPSGFTSWDNVAIDQEDFSRFRESDLTRDMLESCYVTMRSQYFLHLGQRLEAVRDSWQVAEVLLLMMQQVSSVTLSYLEHGHLGTAANPNTAQDRADTARFILEMIHKFTEVPERYAHPLVLRSLVRLVGSYHVLLSPRGGPNSALQHLISQEQSTALYRLVLRCLLQGLSSEDAGEAASMALRIVCVTPGGLAVVTQDRDCLELIMAALETASSANLDINCQLTVVETVVRVVIATNQARAGLNHFTAPILHVLRNALASETGDGQQGEVVARSLRLLGQAVRFLDDKSVASGNVNVAQDLVESLWPLLDQASALYQGQAEVMDDVFQVYRHMIVGLRPLVAPRLQQLLTTVVQLYRNNPHEGALDVVRTVADIFKDVSAEDEQVFADLLSTVCQQTWEYMRTGVVAPVECPGLITAFFDMLLSYLTSRATVLYQSAEFPNLLGFALTCLEAAERESTRSVLRWLRDVFISIEANCQDPAVVIPVRMLEERGQQFIKVTMAALAGGAPSTLWANYYELFYTMYTVWGTLAAAATGGQPSNPCLAWIHGAVFDPAVIGDVMPAESREMVVGLIEAQALESKQKLKVFMDDLAKICKSEKEPDALKSYAARIPETRTSR